MTQQELKHILSSKFDFEKWKDLLGTMFLKIDYLTKPIQIEAALVKSGGQVGVIRLDDGRSLGLFKFEVADNIKIARNRKGLRDIAIKYVDQDITHGALVFYYSEDQADYRLTFVSKQTSLNEDGEFVTKATAPKRYTFLLGENEPCTTAANRLLELINKKKSGSVYLADVTEAFSVERLNKDFFKGYKDQYGKFLNYIGEQSKANRDYVKKLLGRLVFLQFLQKKGWMGAPVNNTNWEGGDKNYLNNLIEKYKGNNRLLSDVLEVLFFNTLNEKRDNDLADKILGENIKIPYLNGGLFDKDSLDKLDIDFPYDYFKELMEFFAIYNFTIDENDPDDAEVGVDPEMLGHIFENLLEDNKDKGAFYTPKEIVQYMSQESIAQYLKTHTEKTLHTAIEGLIKERKVDEALQNKASASKVYDLLRDVKVCDPAIGSGAFPMGVLNVLYHSRQVLYGFTKSMEPFSPAAVKREIIQNNIYGVDIEQGAIDIARLRFWLALVVDELKPEPLPNLDYKIMQGNSLLESFEGLDMSRIAGRTVGRPSNSPQLIIGLDSDLNRKNLQKLMRQYFSTDDHTAKAELRQTINNEVKSLIRNSLGGTTASLNHLEQLDCSANSDFFLWHTWFKDVFDNGGFDVVIGNPPYIGEKGHKELFVPIKNSQSLGEYYLGKMDYFYFFFHLALNILKHMGICTMITTNYYPTANGARLLRADFVKRAAILQLINFNEFKIFESALGQHNLITMLEKTCDNKISCKLLNTSKKGFYKDKIKSVLNAHDEDVNVSYLSQSELYESEENYIRLNVSIDESDRLSSIFAKMQNGNEMLGTICNVNTGLFTACDRVFVDDIQNFTDKFSTNELEKSILKPFFKNSDIDRYYTNENCKKLLIYHHEKATYSLSEIPHIFSYLTNYRDVLEQRRDNSLKGALKRGRWDVMALPKVSIDFCGPKVVAPQRSKINTFGYNEVSWYASADVYYITKPKPKYQLKYLLGLLNSKLYYVWLYYKGKRKGEILELYQTPLSLIPIKEADISQQLLIVSIVDKIIAAKKENPQANTGEMEREIDLLVFKLYGLNYEEVLIVDPETSITKVEYESMII